MLGKEVLHLGEAGEGKFAPCRGRERRCCIKERLGEVDWHLLEAREGSFALRMGRGWRFCT